MRVILVGGSLICGLVLSAFDRVPPGRSAMAESIEKRAGELRVLNPGSSGADVVRAQILLDRARYSPGEIDGKYGEDLAIAVKSYQAAHELKPSGAINAETWKLLDRDEKALTTTYVITAADVKGPFVPIPKDVQEEAKMKWLGYDSAEEGLGEKFHESKRLLTEMNPGTKFDTAGVTIFVPNVKRALPGRALRVVVSKSKRTVTALGIADKVLGVYPATIGGEHDPLPVGSWKIASVTPYPWFYFQPLRYWNANPKEATAKLAPGPRNPAGVVWMGLSKPHYGIHGTPDPGRIRHGESYGCIRMTNWDALDLSHMVRAGTPAILEE
jgi:lipoprotein-anchoring transpeptidase ErfK/SrfK